MGRHERLANPITPTNFGQSHTLADAARLHSTERRAFVDVLIARFGDAPLALINQAWAEAAERALYPRAAAATRVRQFWTPLIAMLHAGRKAGLCSETKLVRPKIETVAPLRFFTPAEAQTVIQSSAPHLGRQLRFMLCTGSHPNELFGLRWNAINPETRELRLSSYDGHVTAVLPNQLLADMVRYRDRTEFVFGHYDGRSYSAKEDSGGQNKTSLRTAARRAGVQRFTLTHVRQTWAAWSLALYGYDHLLYAARWSSERSATRYKTIRPEQLREIRTALLSDEFEICQLFRATHWPIDVEGTA